MSEMFALVVGVVPAIIMLFIVMVMFSTIGGRRNIFGDMMWAVIVLGIVLGLGGIIVDDVETVGNTSAVPTFEWVRVEQETTESVLTCDVFNDGTEDCYYMERVEVEPEPEPKNYKAEDTYCEVNDC